MIAKVGQRIRNWAAFVDWSFVVIVTLVLLACCLAFGQTIDITGTDKSGDLETVNDLGKTAVSILYNVIARVVGAYLVFKGIVSITKREVVWGAVEAVLGGCCFFLEKIITSLASLGD